MGYKKQSSRKRTFKKNSYRRRKKTMRRKASSRRRKTTTKRQEQLIDILRPIFSTPSLPSPYMRAMTTPVATIETQVATITPEEVAKYLSNEDTNDLVNVVKKSADTLEPRRQGRGRSTYDIPGVKYVLAGELIAEISVTIIQKMLKVAVIFFGYDTTKQLASLLSDTTFVQQIIANATEIFTQTVGQSPDTVVALVKSVEQALIDALKTTFNIYVMIGITGLISAISLVTIGMFKTYQWSVSQNEGPKTPVSPFSA